MSDDDELGLFGVFLDKVGETEDVRFIQCRVNFIKNAEGARLNFEHSKQQGNGNKRSLATGELCDALRPLSGGTGDDVNP